MKDSKAFSSFSVKDLEETRKFYTQVLGLETSGFAGMEDLLLIKCGGGHTVMAYRKDNHEPATFTVLNFPVEDLEAAVEKLGAQGVRFEQYHSHGIETDPKGISREEGMAIAWFKDPSGNILSVLQESKTGRKEELEEVGSGMSI